MNKTERNKVINKQIYHFAEILGYDVDMSEIDVMFIPDDGNMDNIIEYRRSSQSVYNSNHSSDNTKLNISLMEEYIINLNKMDDDTLKSECGLN